MRTESRVIRCKPWLLALLCAGLCCVSFAPAYAAELPDQISDTEFWRLVSELSEEDGSFPFDNFVSNEDTYQSVMPSLMAAAHTGGVYLGVGPEQNFTYIAALQPRIAFIVDIRRQNMIEHLLYKSLFELSADRGEFVSLLFSRKRPSGIDGRSSSAALFEGLQKADRDRDMLRSTRQRVLDHLSIRHGFLLTEIDKESLSYVLQAFFEAGPGLSYGFRSGRTSGPSYANLMAATDGNGRAWGYLATEEYFRSIQAMQKKNLIVPVVGNFAGNRSIQAIGQYLKDHEAAVTVFYTSNVEQYLFKQGDDWRKFYTNVGTLPLDASSTFIRSESNYFSLPPAQTGGSWLSLICSMRDLLQAFQKGRIQNYYDVFVMSK